MIRQPFIQEDDVRIGENLDTGYFVVLRKGCTIGDNVSIWSQSVIDPGAKIGNNVRMHVGCYISQNSVIEDDVFFGPGVSVLNDRYPPRYDESLWEPPLIKKGAVIGGDVTICPGVTIGEKAIIGAGAVVVKDVPADQIWAGVPARRLR